MDTQLVGTELVLATRPAPLALEFIVAPAEDERASVWLRCRDAWLASIERRARGSTNTRRAYEGDYSQFFGFFETWRTPRPDGSADVGLKPWQVGGAHVELWIEHLHNQGMSDATVNRKLAALSSFYNFAMYKYSIQTDACVARALWPSPNPFKVPDRVQVEPYGRSVYPSEADVQAILREIVRDGRISAAQRQRNLALIGGMFLTTRRVSEWRTLRWGQVHEGDGGAWFDYRYKGGKSKRQAIPKAVWGWLRSYLELDGRWGTLEPDAPVFVATTDTARRFVRRDGRGAQVAADYDPAKQPISSHRVNDLLKRYGRRAGVAEELLHAHGLRHAGARARLADGADVYEIRDVLGHSNIAITQIYTERVLSTPTDSRGDALAAKVESQLRLL